MANSWLIFFFNLSNAFGEVIQPLTLHHLNVFPIMDFRLSKHVFCNVCRCIHIFCQVVVGRQILVKFKKKIGPSEI